MQKFFSFRRFSGLRLLVTAVLLCAAFLLLCTPLSAAELLSYATPGYSGTETAVFAPVNTDTTQRLGIYTTNWSFSGDVLWEKRHNTDGIPFVSATLLPASEFAHTGTATPAFRGETTLSLSYSRWNYAFDDTASLYFGVLVETDEEVTACPLTVTLTMENGEEFTSQIHTAANSWNLIVMDTRPVSGTLSDITITASYSRSDIPYRFRVSAPYRSTETARIFTSAERFSAAKLTASTGVVTSYSGKILPENGRAVISGDLLSYTLHESGTDACFLLSFSGVSAGSLSLTLTCIAEDGSSVQVTSPRIALSDSTASAQSVVIPTAVPGTPVSYTLLFDHVDCHVYFTLESVSILSGTLPTASGNPSIGSVRVLSRDGTDLRFEGTMERDAVKAFSGENLYFYAIPAKTANDLTTAFRLSDIKVSTVFSHTVDLSRTPAFADTFLFFAAVQSVGADGKTTLLPLSKPRYPDAVPLSAPEVSSIGLASAASVGVFESNVSHVLVDLPLDSLLSTSGDTTFSYVDYDKTEGSSARQVHVSRSLLSSLDRDIHFYISSGTRVYLRLFADAEMPGFTFGGEASAYIPDFSLSGVRYLWAAVIRFLAERYPGIEGFVLGCGVNDADTVGADAFVYETDYSGSEIPSDSTAHPLMTYAASLADLCRVTYNAAQPFLTDPLVIVPFTPDENASLPMHILTPLLSERMAETGSFPWLMQIEIADPKTGNTDDIAPQLASLPSLYQLLGELSLSAPDSLTMHYRPDNDTLLLEYGNTAEAMRVSGKKVPEYSTYAAGQFAALYDLCASYRPRAVFVSLAALSLKNNHDFYSELKSVHAAGDTAPEISSPLPSQKEHPSSAQSSGRYIYESAAKTGLPDSENRYVIFDFSAAQYPLGWIAGGGVDFCLTEVSPRFSDAADAGQVRVLRSVFSEDMEAVDNAGNRTGGIAGITLRNLSRRYDFSDLTALDFTFAVERSAASSSDTPAAQADVILVIGTDEWRAEYSASVPLGEIVTLSCSLTGYAYRHAVDYIGIMVYADEEVVLDLASAASSSDVLTAEDMAAMFTPASEEVYGDLAAAAVILGTAAAAAVIILILLTHRVREEDERRTAAEQNRSRRKYS